MVSGQDYFAEEELKGSKWTVEVEYWPRRFRDENAQGDTSVTVDWAYRVEENKNSEGINIFQSDGEDTYLLKTTDSNKLKNVYRIVENEKEVYKLQHIHSRVLQEGPFFYLPDEEHPPVIWYHPVRKNKKDRQRFNFHRHSSRPGDWMYQQVKQQDDIFQYKLVYEPEEIEIEFNWPEAAPWWKKAVWRRRGRVVAVAKTTFSSTD
ncbi:MAG: hypothetical protein ACQEP7_02475 [bacterium]